MPEIVGKAGILVDANDEVAIAQAMEQIAGTRKLRDNLIAKSKKQAKKFSAEKFAQKILDTVSKINVK